MTAFLRDVRLLRVVLAHPNRGAGWRLYGLLLTFAPGGLLYVMQRPLGRVA
jgi:hypothetical protein